MPMFPFVGGSYTARSRAFDAQRTLNLYAEASESGTSKSVAALYCTPGLETWATCGTGPIRGQLRFDSNRLVVVSGAQVFVVSGGGIPVMVGAISAGTTPVSMASNGIVVMIATNPNAYAVNPAALTISPIITSEFLGADRVAFIDGYFVWSVPNTQKFQISRVYSTDTDALDFAVAEGAPDNVVSLIVDHREVWLFGENSTEVWANGGGVDFPFTRIDGAFIEAGCLAPASVAKLDNGVIWLGADERGYGTVFRAQGYTPTRISNFALETAIAGYTGREQAHAWTYGQEGHLFYVLTFPADKATWVYDAATQLWHERAWRDPATGVVSHHRGLSQASFAGMTLIGDRETGKIYRMAMELLTDDGALIVRERTAPYISGSEYNQVLFHRLQIDMQVGIGNDAAADPQIMLSWSDDQGLSWSNELWTSAGRIGERHRRAIWNRLGKSRGRVFRVRITDPVDVVFIGAAVRAQETAA